MRIFLFGLQISIVIVEHDMRLLKDIKNRTTHNQEIFLLATHIFQMKSLSERDI